MHWYLQNVSRWLEQRWPRIDPAPVALTEQGVRLLGAPAEGVLILLADATHWPAAELAALQETALALASNVAAAQGQRPVAAQCIVLLEHGLPPGAAVALPALQRRSGATTVSLSLVDPVGQTVHTGRGAALVPANVLREMWEAGPARLAASDADAAAEATSPAHTAHGDRAQTTVRLPRAGQPRVTYALLAAIVLIHLAGAVLVERQTGLGWPTILGSQVNVLVWAGQWWRPLTATFLHADLIHLMFNGWALYQLGPVIERFFGRVRLLVIWVAAGLAGNWLFLLLGPPQVISVGASGAIFGLFGALVVFGLRFREHIRPGFWANIVITLAINAYIGLTVVFVNNWAHLGGFIWGLLWAVALVLVPKGTWRWLAGALVLASEVALVLAAYARG